ncbi:hypothetical protein LUX05_24605 [Streptomyces somaliensis]|nr:hypothetical protein [Streptomyces somaliensis]
MADWGVHRGRGLFLVEAVSASWGSVLVSGGKQERTRVVTRGPGHRRPDLRRPPPARGPGREGG